MDKHFFEVVEQSDTEASEEKKTEDRKVDGEQAEEIIERPSRDANAPSQDSDRKDLKKQEKKPAGVLAELIDWVKVIAVAAVLAFFLINFIIANSTIPTGSMQDTIMAGARVFGSRLTYTFGEVKRGDIAIFVYGYTCKECGQTYRETDQGVCPYCGREDKKNSVIYYVKRVIGMPGDHIEIRQTGTADASEFHNIQIGQNPDGSSMQVPVGTVYVNGEAIAETYLPEPMIVDGNQFPEVDVTVPEGSYYMLGDNRNNSMDARYWGDYNMVSRDKMVAKVYVKYWPLNDMGLVK